ncbi:riboflavin kinase [Batrachochytrium dendrobatidis]|nr:riboflavin kinase [Batrachochytrium dendrobatidis]KAK5669352.1 riboflavin kinase [Batrachochytrium dendrobatidis]
MIRPDVVGPEQPQSPYPVQLSGIVSKGFGRGGKQLGIPTANLPENVAQTAGELLETGIYYGWACVGHDASSAVLPMVMSFGWNPFYKNEKRSAEVHIIHEFPKDFYGADLRVIVAGYIRPEQNYTSLDALIQDINTDIKVAIQSLQRPAYLALQSHPLFTDST